LRSVNSRGDIKKIKKIAHATDANSFYSVLEASLSDNLKLGFRGLHVLRRAMG
jgi:hypothetical protein